MFSVEVLSLSLVAMFGSSTPSNSQRNARPALLPPLGWNSWAALGCSRLNETAILHTAEVMIAAKLQHAGYKWIMLDDCWMASTRDENGLLQADKTKFPNGMKFLVTQLEKRGFHLGLYTTPGNFTHEGRPASGGHLSQDLKLWIHDWGVRYVKLCVANTTREIRESAYGTARDIIDTMEEGSGVVLECVNIHGEELDWWVRDQSHHCNVWRVQDDVANSFAGWSSALAFHNQWISYSRTSHWLMPDLIPLAYTDANTYTNEKRQVTGQAPAQTLVELRAQLIMYALIGSPLMISWDMPNVPASVLELLKNEGLLRVSQSATPPGSRLNTLASKDHNTMGPSVNMNVEVWGRQLQDQTVAFAILNRGPQPAPNSTSLGTKSKVMATATIHFDALKSQFRFPLVTRGRVRIIDLWTGKELGVFVKEYTTSVAEHDARLMLAMPIDCEDDSL